MIPENWNEVDHEEVADIMGEFFRNMIDDISKAEWQAQMSKMAPSGAYPFGAYNAQTEQNNEGLRRQAPMAHGTVEIDLSPGEYGEIKDTQNAMRLLVLGGSRLI